MENSGEITFYCKEESPRLAYVIHHIESQLGIQFRIVHEPVETGIYYGNTPGTGKLKIYSSGILNETSIRAINPAIEKAHGTTVLFPAPTGFDLSFDIFSAIFFMLSRYEEYLPFKPDQFGRFEAEESLAFRGNFLEEPVVDQWIRIFKELIRKKYPYVRLVETGYSFQLTLDIDNPWAFRHRGSLRNTGGLIRDVIGLKENVLRRLGALSHIIKDPYDVYSWIREQEDECGINSIYFFLSGDYGAYDVNYALRTGAFRKLIRRMSEDRLIGIHPSYKSNASFELLKEEYEVFSDILGKRPIISRQHFLIINLPETYNRLISLGIKHDYSMGFASMPGFRAGSSRPFIFYDLENERETELTVHPFILMDVTLRQYLKMIIPLAKEKVIDLTNKVKSVDGAFTLLWHNESLCGYGEWKEWDEVFKLALGIREQFMDSEI